MKKSLTIIISVIVLLLLVGLAYLFFFFHGPGNTVTVTAPPQRVSNGFAPLNTNAPQNGAGQSSASSTYNSYPPANQPDTVKIATLRMISGTPVGGYAATTSASSTVLRWIDRGRGNVYELPLETETVATLSNTIIPRLYESVWNKSMTAFIGSIYDTSGTPTTLYAALQPQESSTSTDQSGNNIVNTPFVLRGTNLPSNVIGYAVAPKSDKLFLLMNESGVGVGYISNFDGSKMTKLFDTPLTQVNVEWPETNTIAITTKGAANEGGFLYFVNVKTGAWKKILGPVAGLSTRVSHDAKYVLASSASTDQNVNTAIYTVASNNLSNAVVRTLADKCVWGNFNMNVVYCAAPSQPVTGTYPDDWYTGSLSTVDKIWQINAATGVVHLVSTLVDQSDRVIDAINLGLDPRDGYLFFMNKNDLSLWSFDLISSGN